MPSRYATELASRFAMIQVWYDAGRLFHTRSPANSKSTLGRWSRIICFASSRSSAGQLGTPAAIAAAVVLMTFESSTEIFGSDIDGCVFAARMRNSASTRASSRSRSSTCAT